MSKNIRKNLMVGVDHAGEQDVIVLKTTSTNDIIVEITGGINKMSVDIENLQAGIDELRNFIKERPEQPKSAKSLTAVDLEKIQEGRKSEDQVVAGLKQEFGFS